MSISGEELEAQHLDLAKSGEQVWPVCLNTLKFILPTLSPSLPFFLLPISILLPVLNLFSKKITMTARLWD